MILPLVAHPYSLVVVVPALTYLVIYIDQPISKHRQVFRRQERLKELYSIFSQCCHTKFYKWAHECLPFYLCRFNQYSYFILGYPL